MDDQGGGHRTDRADQDTEDTVQWTGEWAAVRWNKHDDDQRHAGEAKALPDRGQRRQRDESAPEEQVSG